MAKSNVRVGLTEHEAEACYRLFERLHASKSAQDLFVAIDGGAGDFRRIYQVLEKIEKARQREVRKLADYRAMPIEPMAAEK